MADTVRETPPDNLLPNVDHPAGPGVVKPGYAPRLANEDLAPLRKQSWTSYNIFAFWMSDVHSVGGYVTAGSATGSATATTRTRCWPSSSPGYRRFSRC